MPAADPVVAPPESDEVDELAGETIADAVPAVSEDSVGDDDLPDGAESLPEVDDDLPEVDDDLPEADDELPGADDDELPGADEALPELAEDEAPLIGADLSVPPVAEGADEDDGDAPAVVAHMQSMAPDAAAAVPDPGVGGRVIDDELVLFDDENPTEEIIVDPAISDDALEAGIDATTLSPDDVDSVDDNSLPGFDDDDAPSPVAAVAAVAGVAAKASGVPDDAIPDMSLPELPDDDAPRGAPVFADDGSGEAFFGDEEEDPPTEDSVGPLPQDFSSLYRAPMDIPEPPPIPGILDRYTPAPVRNQGARSSSGYVPVPPKNVAAPIITPPVGLWDDPPSAGGSRGSAKETPPPPSYKAAPAVEEETTFYQDTWFLVAVAFAALTALAVLIVLFWVSSQNPSQTDVDTASTGVETPVAPPSERPSADLVPSTNLDETDGLPGADPATPAPGPETLPTPAVIPSPEPGLRPSVTPSTAPTTPAVTTPPAPAGRTGRLKIRSAKQVLVYVNGQPVGLTPLDLDRPAGKYTVTVRVNGQQRSERVELSPGTIRLVDF